MGSTGFQRQPDKIYYSLRWDGLWSNGASLYLVQVIRLDDLCGSYL